MFGYCDIRPGAERHDSVSGLLSFFIKEWNLAQEDEGELRVYISHNKGVPFLGVRLGRKEDILPALKAFLKQDRWEK